MSKDTNTIIQTPVGELSLIEHDIILLKYFNMYIDKVSDIEKLAEQVHALSVTERNLALLDTRELKGASREVRKMAASDPMNTAAAAMLVNSAITKILANVFMKFNKPSYPTKIFTKKDDAIKWLLTFK